MILALNANEYIKLGGLAYIFRSLGLIDSIITITSAKLPRSYVYES